MAKASFISLWCLLMASHIPLALYELLRVVADAVDEVTDMDDDDDGDVDADFVSSMDVRGVVVVEADIVAVFGRYKMLSGVLKQVGRIPLIVDAIWKAI
ncbi:hypothetical protein BKA66DRAFT_479439 [Pyrenochaeta sp. MPI-SDFR-AT-0127]|nr:hypothetical protein BKA66DRAFT_479439 [Pyrenochaeta sp. MPI-SDFR-AT-0127]